jgi:hypothetical protein
LLSQLKSFMMPPKIGQSKSTIVHGIS